MDAHKENLYEKIKNMGDLGTLLYKQQEEIINKIDAQDKLLKEFAVAFNLMMRSLDEIYSLEQQFYSGNTSEEQKKKKGKKGPEVDWFGDSKLE